MTKYNNIFNWASDIDPRMFYEAKILNEVREFGFDVEVARKKDWNYAEISSNGANARISLRTWDDDFNSLVARGLPFFVLDKNHVGEILNKVKDGTGYGVAPFSDEIIQQLGFMGVGYIVKDDDEDRSLTCLGSDIIRSITVVVCGYAPGDKFHGIGFAARSNLEAMGEALQAA